MIRAALNLAIAFACLGFAVGLFALTGCATAPQRFHIRAIEDDDDAGPHRLPLGCVQGDFEPPLCPVTT